MNNHIPRLEINNQKDPHEPPQPDRKPPPPGQGPRKPRVTNRWREYLVDVDSAGQ